MANARMKLAVYTTIYPGVEPYLPDWCRSLLGQTDQSSDLWIRAGHLWARKQLSKYSAAR